MKVAWGRGSRFSHISETLNYKNEVIMSEKKDRFDVKNITYNIESRDSVVPSEA